MSNKDNDTGMGSPRQSRSAPVLRIADPLPVCPWCGSPHVKSFDLDWIEVAPGAWECVDCGVAFRPEAWK